MIKVSILIYPKRLISISIIYNPAMLNEFLF
ncbi:hypothetical protein MTBSS4_340003 [Magnetospirillum sp. SS-4]|nr:hypothetical protein MTBSS4_340003 [Magnetospirillum sp. SS-4]